MSSTEDKTIPYIFIGNENDIKTFDIIKYFDTNYIPLNNILLSYYTTKNAQNTDESFLNLLRDLNDTKKPYNNYNIYPITISIIILVIILIILLMRILFFTYYHMYGYILIGLILFIIIIGSVWFLYINNETL
jgi:hypothetical protein|uniref:Uncharacterized protein n=1 Tax=viral metagenome TaxID=1070528 RepID=A0A6C0DMH0_9ZZZZ